MRRPIPLKIIFSLAALSLLIASCKKGDSYAQPSTIRVTVHHNVDQDPLLFDTMLYANDAGNPYEVTQLLYYVSDITFHKPNGVTYTDPSVHYIDARDTSTWTFDVPRVPAGIYNYCTFTLGVPESKNVTGGLPATMENTYMLWPEPMGGGYHFMKLEGYFSTASGDYGFAVHLGKNGFQSHAGCPVTLSLVKAQHAAILELNINEFFRTPYTYNLDTDGNYTMGDSVLMSKISANGQDAFYLRQTQ